MKEWWKPSGLFKSCISKENTSWQVTWMADAYWSILLPILETMGVWDTLGVLLHWWRHVRYQCNDAQMPSSFIKADLSPFLGWFIQEPRLLPNLYKKKESGYKSLSITCQISPGQVVPDQHPRWPHRRADQAVHEDACLYLDILLVSEWTGVSGCWRASSYTNSSRWIVPLTQMPSA